MVRLHALRLLSIPTFLAAVSLAGLAHADAISPNDCTEVGTPCDTAGLNADKPGICVAETCTNHFFDAGFACIRCEPSDGGAVDAGPTPTPDPVPTTNNPTSSNDAGDSTKPTGLASSSSSCSSFPIGMSTAAGCWVFGLVAVGLFVARRRKG